ncbi:3-methyl-2-oxobutanoate hydroxymethyltransferase, partial [Streptomyces sp. SID11233]|nr:3-methyl-2-oxobutanoate hydroxymethyltransferase [Streptomyces sp. SID11233]
MSELSAARAQSETPTGTLYGKAVRRRVTVHDIARAKERGEKWAMLTAYDAMTASVFDESGIPVLLVGDSMG